MFPCSFLVFLTLLCHIYKNNRQKGEKIKVRLRRYPSLFKKPPTFQQTAFFVRIFYPLFTMLLPEKNKLNSLLFNLLYCITLLLLLLYLSEKTVLESVGTCWKRVGNSPFLLESARILN